MYHRTTITGILAAILFLSTNFSCHFVCLPYIVNISDFISTIICILHDICNNEYIYISTTRQTNIIPPTTFCIHKIKKNASGLIFVSRVVYSYTYRALLAHHTPTCIMCLTDDHTVPHNTIV